MLSKVLIGLRSAVVCSLSLLATASLAQATIQVGPGKAYSTIQSGIDAAANGDTVLVAPGTYNENIDFKGKAITVTSSGGAADTTIDGGQKAPAVLFKTSETRASILSGFTITHGGVFDYTVSVNGGIYLQNSAPTIRNNILTQNNCWTIYSQQAAPLIQDNEISATQDPKGNCSFGGGAGVYIGGNLNSSDTSNDGTSPVILGNTIEDNVESGLEDAGGNGGAGIAVWGGSPVIMNNIIRNNSSPGGSGGAINLQGGVGAAVIQNLIYGNFAGCGGGAIAVQSYPDSRTGISALIANNTMANNTGANNGGFSECIAISQIYPSPDSYGESNPAVQFLNNIVSGSTSYPAVNCGWFETPGEKNQPAFQNNILFNGGGPFFGSYCADVSAEYNNIAADPAFIAPSTGDFHLQKSSPAIDHGDNSVFQTFHNLTGLTLSTDLDGHPRPQDTNGKGCIIDMGAYEYPGTQSSCSITETLTSSPNPSTFGQTVTFTAQLSSAIGVPTGDVQFSDGATVLGTESISTAGVSTFTTSALSVGSHNITATYQPTGTFPAGGASVTQVVNAYPTITELSCSATPLYVSQTAQLSAVVTSSMGTPTGSLALTDNGTTVFTAALVNGAATLTYTPSTAGTHALLATFTPTGSFGVSAGGCVQTVNLLPSTSTLSVTPAASTYGSPVTLSATVAPGNAYGTSTPTGTVTFYTGSSPLGTVALGNGAASLTLSTLPGGSNNLTCTYSGNNVYASSSCTTVLLTVNAAASALSLTSSNNPALALTPITFSAALSTNGKPAGAGNTIALSVAGQTVSVITNAAGIATFATNTLTPNTYPVTASFSATSSLLASTASLTQVVSPAPTTTGLTVSPNPAYATQTVTIAATVAAQGTSSQPSSGTITFYDGQTSLGTQSLTASGSATLTTSTLSVGTHPITASFTPASDTFVTSTSPVVNEVIRASGFTIALAPAGIAIKRGAIATVAIQLASVGNFAGPLSLTCGTLPADATASISPATVTLTAGGTGSSTLSINTLVKSASSTRSPAAPAARALPVVFAAFALLFLPFGAARRRNLTRLLGFALVAVALQSTTGCTNAWYTAAAVAPGTYQVPVIATDVNHNTQTATLTITVAP